MEETKGAPAIEAFRCQRCGNVTITSKKLCIKCGNTKIEAVKCAKEGSILVYTTVYYPPDSHKHKGAYNIGLVRLNDGCNVFGLIEGEPQEMSAGAPVTLATYDKEKGEITFSLKRT